MGSSRDFGRNMKRRGRIRTHRKKMNMKNIIIALFAYIIFVLLTGCTERAFRSKSGKPGNHEYDTATFSYFYGEALKQKLLGNAGDALKYLEQCIKINPESDAVYYEIAQISLQHGDSENAKIYCEKALRINSKNVWYLTMTGDLFYQERNLDSAIFYYEMAVKEFPAHDELKMNLGNIYSEKGDFEKAAEIYKDLERKYGKSNSTEILIVRNLISAKKYDEAEKRINDELEGDQENVLYNGLLADIYKSKGEISKAEEVYKKLMNIDSTNLQTVISLIDFYVINRKYDEFFNLLNDIIIDNKFSRDDWMNIFTKILEYSDLIKERGIELEIAVKVLEKSYVSDGVMQVILPELYQKEGKQEQAAERYEELRKSFPDVYYIWEKLLLIYSDLRNYDRLFVLGRECSMKFNMSYVAKVLYASAAMEKKEYDIAMEELEKAKILAGNQDQMLSQVLSMEADLYYRKKEFGKSFEIYRQILKNNPEDILVLNNYAYFLAEQNQDLREAERMIRIVISREKENGTYIDTYAWVLFKRGKYKEAARVMEDLMAVNKTEDSEWFEHYGFIMKALKKCDIAVEYWNRAFKLNNEKDYLKTEIEKCTKR